jgi:hypothetical protein
LLHPGHHLRTGSQQSWYLLSESAFARFLTEARGLLPDRNLSILLQPYVLDWQIGPDRLSDIMMSIQDITPFSIARLLAIEAQTEKAFSATIDGFAIVIFRINSPARQRRFPAIGNRFRSGFGSDLF